MKKKFLRFFTWMKRKGIIIPLAFVFLLAPLISVVLECEFSGQRVTHVPTAIVDEDDSSLSRGLTEKIKTNQFFDIKYYEGNDAEIKKMMDAGEISAAIIIPDDFEEDFTNGQNPKVMAVYDGTQMAMAGAVKNGMAEVLGTIRSGYLLQIMEGKLGINALEAQKYVQPIAYTTRFLGNPAKSTPNYMIQGILVNIVQVTIFILGIELIDKKKRNFRVYISENIFCGIAGTVSALICMAIQTLFFDNPFNGDPFAAIVLIFLNMTALSGVGMLLRLRLKKKLSAVELSTLVFATVLLSGYTFPAIAMMPAFQKLAKWVPFTYFGIPLRNITLLGDGFPETAGALFWFAKLIVLIWAGIYFLCRRKSPEAEEDLDKKLEIEAGV